jgi:4'-phosphopantetheinyl transferase
MTQGALSHSDLVPRWLDVDAWLASLACAETGALHALVVEIEDLAAPNVSSSFEALLDSEDRERASQFRFTADRNRFVIAHAILRLVASRATGVKPDMIEFASLPRTGLPPRIVAPPQAPQLSLSHSDRYIGIALGRGQPIGIDVEGPRPLPDADALAEVVFTPSEIRDFTSLPPGERRRVFLQWWTAKEAALKAEGTGFATPPDQVVLHYDRSWLPDAAVVPSKNGRHSYVVRVFDPFAASAAIAAIAAAGYATLLLNYTRAASFALAARR